MKLTASEIANISVKYCSMEIEGCYHTRQFPTREALFDFISECVDAELQKRREEILQGRGTKR